jgi:S-methylmethionine-dependent homocysteine/selenocysteine methylase
MAKPKVAFSLRLSANTHEQIKLIAEHNNESITATIEKAIDKFLVETDIILTVKTDNDDYSIRVEKDAAGWSIMTLYSHYVGIDHISINCVSPDYYDEAIEKLKSLVDFVDGAII